MIGQERYFDCLQKYINSDQSEANVYCLGALTINALKHWFRVDLITASSIPNGQVMTFTAFLHLAKEIMSNTKETLEPNLG